MRGARRAGIRQQTGAGRLFVGAVDTDVDRGDHHRDGPDALGRLRGGPQDTRLAGDRCAFAGLVLDAAVGTGGQFDSGNPVIGLRMRRRARGGEAGKKREQGKDATKHCSGQIGRVAMRVHPA